MVLMVIVMHVIVAVVLADAADVVVVADLRRSHGVFVAGKPHAVLAEFAIHVRAAVDGLAGPVKEYLEEERVGFQIIGREEFRLWMQRGELGGLAADALFEDPGEEEKRKDDDPAEAHPVAPLKGLGDER